MRRSSPVNKTVQIGAWISALIIIILPVHAFITVWLSSALDHYILLRLWKEVLLVPIVIISIYLLASDRKLRKAFLESKLIRLILVYLLALVIWAPAGLITHKVTGKAMWYGLMVDSRFLVFFLCTFAISSKTGWLEERWQKLLFGPAIFVASFAILQYLVLPYDFLRHFGYNDSTINPYETINHNIHHLRVASTLRGANPLGAYLILPISVLVVMLIKIKNQRKNIAVFGAGLLLALVFSFSRSAWLGTLLAVAVAAWLSIKHSMVKRILLIAGIALLIIGILIAVILRNNSNLQNIVYHTDNSSIAFESSNQGHSLAFKNAGNDILHEPLGRGVGTAGPASTYNNGHFWRISENFFMQIGQEAGWIGMLLFIAICAVAGLMLFERRADPLALALLASLIGITFVNLLSHAWTDDTLAYIWWGLAGIALSPVLKSRDT
jgi:hypothetical protein